MTDTNQPTQSNDQPSDHASGVGPIEQVTRTLTADDMPIINAAPHHPTASYSHLSFILISLNWLLF